MKALVKYQEGGLNKSIEFDAFDLDTIKKAANQWRVKELINRKRRIVIQDISPISNSTD